jgi:hypothetical protein
LLRDGLDKRNGKGKAPAVKPRPLYKSAIKADEIELPSDDGPTEEEDGEYSSGSRPQKGQFSYLPQVLCSN